MKLDKIEEPYVTKLREEYHTANLNYNKLASFIDTPKYDELSVEMRGLLARQCTVLDRYQSILEDRLDLIAKEG